MKKQARHLPSAASNSDFSSGDSVAVTGQMGTTNPLAGIDFSQMRDNAELNQSLNGGPGGQGPGSRRSRGEGGSGGGGGFGGGGFGGFGGGGRGGGGGGMRGNFRNFKPNQPHGALFWNGGNGALNADDFALRGQPFQQPAYSSNRFGLTFLSAPYIPKILTHDQERFPLPHPLRHAQLVALRPVRHRPHARRARRRLQRPHHARWHAHRDLQSGEPQDAPQTATHQARLSSAMSFPSQCIVSQAERAPQLRSPAQP
jgi:hypothetical protein